MKLGENLNSTFSNVYVRNILRATTRLAIFKQHADAIGLNYEVFNAIEGNNYVQEDYRIKYRPELYPTPANKYLVGNCYSGIAVLLDAMANNYESFITCDDDAIFYNLELEYIKPHLPEVWDIIILGDMWKVATQDRTVPIFEKLSDTPTYIAGCHVIAVHSRVYNTYLMEMVKFDAHGRIGDALIHMLVQNNKIELYRMLPHITYQERNILPPYTII